MMERPQVCIIGGGMAGLSCARRLMEMHMADVTVYEAMDRLGGRVQTMYCEGGGDNPYKLEMGANWIHGCVGNPVFKIAKDHQLLEKIVSKSKPLTRKELVTLTENGDVVETETVRYVTRLYSELNDQCDEFYKTSLPVGYHKNCSVEDYIRKESGKLFTEKYKHQPGTLQLHQNLINSFLKFETTITGCDSMSEVSLKQFGSYEYLRGGDLPIGQGFSKVIEVLAKDIPTEHIFLKTPVASISWESNYSGKTKSLLKCCTAQKETTASTHKGSEDVTAEAQEYPQNKVKVKLSDGSEHMYDHVIVTCSLGYLKHSHKTLFQPALPEGKIHAINHLGYGTVDKIYLVYENLNFLPEKLLRLKLSWNTESKDKSNEVPDWVRKIVMFGCIKTPHDNTLVAWITGLEAEYMESLCEQEVGEGCTAALRIFFKNKDIPNPKKVIRTKWSQEPFIRGSYSFIKIGATVQDIETLAEPICDNTTGKPVVQFAGEATDSQHYSTTHGAYLSGEREADRLWKYYHKQDTVQEIP